MVGGIIRVLKDRSSQLLSAVLRTSGWCDNSSPCSANLSTNGGSITTFQAAVTDHDNVAAGSEWGVNVCSGAAPSGGPPPPKC
jgi:hypothetical protein